MKIAVLVPVYNAERYLRECLESILAQGVDVFCCDDGSTDGSRAILEDYVARGARLNYISQANAGVVAARNRLLDKLPTEYEAFAFCDADDVVRKGMYARLAEALERTGADVAESGMPGNEVSAETVVSDMSVYVLRRTAPGPWINVVNKLYRREAVETVRFRTGLRFEEDFFFNYEINAVIQKKVLLPGVDYTYRTNPDSATQSLNHAHYFASAAERIRLSLDVFLAADRIPRALEKGFVEELSKDAYRMCLRKNLKKNTDAKLRRELFHQAGEHFAKLERTYGFVPVGLNPIQAAIWQASRNGHYALARFLAYLT